MKLFKTFLVFSIALVIVLPGVVVASVGGDVEIENQRPSIKLIGDNPLVMALGDTFADPGATASDVEDGDLTSAITVVPSSIDTTSPGGYLMLYSVVDSGGWKRSVKRIVTVLPDSYAPYCGDGEVNQSWEQCDGGNTCSNTCQSPSESVCSDLILARVNVDSFTSENTTSDIFVGSKSNRIPSGTWFEIYSGGNFLTDSDIKSYKNVPGLAIQRLNGELRLVLSGGGLYGGNASFRRRYQGGNIEFLGATVTDQKNDARAPSMNPLEKGFDGSKGLNGDDEVWLDESMPSKSFYWLIVGGRDDGFYTQYSDPLVCLENEDPIIVLKGSSTINLIVGDTFTDPGATASDVEDGDLTSSITVVPSSVDTTSPGSYQMLYSVVDSGGLEKHVKRMVIVLPDSYAPYCGDGEVNQSWEQCDGGNIDGGNTCSSTCQSPSESVCSDLILARVNVDSFTSENTTSDIFVGSKANRIPSGTWFAIYSGGNFLTDSDIKSYKNVPGLAIQRLSGELRLALYGSTANPNKRHQSGNIEFLGATVTDQKNDARAPSMNPLEKGFDGSKGDMKDDEVWLDESMPSKSFYWLTVTGGDDGFYTQYSDPLVCFENEDPIIVLNGSSTINLIVGDTFADPGATASDLEDGDLTSQIDVGGDVVDTLTVGTYVITYDVVDSAGASASQQLRTVNIKNKVIDPDPDPEPSPSPSGGGGGGNVLARLLINNDDSETDSADVELNLTPPGAVDQMMISNDADFTDVEWQAFNSNTTWTLLPGMGSKTVYVKFATNGGQIGYVISDDILLTAGEVLGETIDVEVPTCGIYLNDYLKFGADNDSFEVKKLQQFLSDYGYGSLDISGVFDEATLEAVKAFQLAEKETILDPWIAYGLAPNTATGYVYKTTLYRINQIMCPSLDISAPAIP